MRPPCLPGPCVHGTAWLHPNSITDVDAHLSRALDDYHVSVLVSAGPMLEADGAVFSKRWGYLSRAGLNDKSQMTRQIEKYADIFTSRSGRKCPGPPFALGHLQLLVKACRQVDAVPLCQPAF